MKHLIGIVIVFVATTATNSFAYDWQVDTTIRLVQPTYMPNIVSFQVNDSAGACSQGAWLRWEARGDTEAEKHANSNAVYSTLLAAFMAKKTVRIYGVNENCRVDFLHLF